MKPLSTEELLFRLVNSEDSFVERKVHSDSKDWLKTVIAFANSVPLGGTGILFIGVRNNGSIEENLNLDSIQKSLNQKLADAYPSVYYVCEVVRYKGHECLAVVIPGSSQRPHFARPAYVRVGSETKKASEPEFERLIAERNSKAYAILHAKDRKVRVKWSKEPEFFSLLGPDRLFIDWTVEHCDQFTVTLTAQGYGATHRIPLERIGIVRDSSENTILLEVYER